MWGLGVGGKEGLSDGECLGVVIGVVRVTGRCECVSFVIWRGAWFR